MPAVQLHLLRGLLRGPIGQPARGLLPGVVNSALPSDDPLAARLRGFGPLGLAAILAVALANAVVKPLGAILALLWAWRSHTPWREIGYVRPKSWIVSLA